MEKPHKRSARLRAALAGAGAAVLVAGAGIVAVDGGRASAATPACAVTYSVGNQWNTGFTTYITITNNAAAINGWTFGFSFSAGQTVTQGWSGNWSQSGPNVTVTNVGYNASIATGASIQIGFNGSWSGSNPAPTTFTLNGVTCNGGSGGSPSPSASATSASASPSSSPTGGTGGGPAPQLHVSGNKLVNQNGNTVVLHGVDRSGGEFSCVQGNGIWNGPMDQASVTAIKGWNADAVRVPLNEACWNGESYVNSAYAGSNYINAVKAYVSLLNSNGIVAILDLHWTDGLYTGTSSGCSSAQATCQKPMPDTAQAIPFWTSVANTFKGDNAVVFDLFNEPYPERADNYTETGGWQCWLNGGSCAGIGYQVAGMQSMVNAVRSTGASNVLMLGGLAYSNDLTQWLNYKPRDPDNNLTASWHSYNFNSCNNQSCWSSQIAPVIAQVPLITGEIGENDCAGGYIGPLMSWLDSQGSGYLAWTWNNWDCSSGPSLVSDYSGTPTNYGSAYKAHLASVG